MKYLLNKKINIFILALFISIIPNITKAAFVGASAPVTATTSCNTGLSCGLVGYWTFDGKDIVNGVILDKSGTGNNGNPVSIASSTFYAPGKIGQGVNFNGYVRVPDNSSLKPSGAMSWGGWVYQKTTNVNQSFLSKVTIGTQGYMIYNSANSSTFCFAYGLTPSSLSDALGAVQTNRWVHYMCVYDGSTLKLYRNGALLSSVSVTGSITHSTNQLNIGSYNSGARFVGLVDEVRVYNRALSAQEVQQLYNMGASNKIGSTVVASSTNACTTGISCGLVGYWTFDGKDILNGVLLDKSGNNISGNLINIASTTFFSPGKISQAFRFDGVNDYINLSSSTTLNNGNWTVSVWAKLSGNNAQYILTNQSSGPVVNALGIYTRKMLYYHYNGSWITDTGNAIVANNMWHLLTWVNHSDQTMEMYVDGVLDASGLSSSVVSTGPVNRIGSGYGAPPNNNFVNGYIDDLRVYNRALSDKEVQQLYSMGANNKLGSSATASSTTACTVGLACGLVGYWTFDGKDISNGVLLDKSGNNNKGNFVNIASTTFYTPGKLGQAGNFDGVNDKVLMGDNLDLIGSPLTISAWVNPTSYSGLSSNSPSIVDKLLVGGNYRLNLLSTGNAVFVIRDAGGSAEQVVSTNNSVPLNKWTHVLATYDNSTTGRIYINGVLNSSKTNFTLTRGDTSSQLQIGNNDNNANSIFSGKIDDVRIYNRVLSDKEIQQLYSQSR